MNKRCNCISTCALGTGHKLEGGRAGANSGRAIVFHVSTNRVKQFGACHQGGGEVVGGPNETPLFPSRYS